ncbi:WD domain-containing protein [Hortaea werneckii]|nr:WD domain-containing protein [Hortaea werneckii]KAI7502381.1 WD domain-containing protein [Hortaea werneckii]
MSDDVDATDESLLHLPPPAVAAPNDQPSNGAAEPEPEADDEEEEEDDEPKMKYTQLTGSLSGIYRNGDSTSAFTVAGDKMVVGTHSGNTHVLGLPGLQLIRSYRAHSATITSVSISPTPPPPSTVKAQDGSTQVLAPSGPQGRTQSIRDSTSTTNSPRAPSGSNQQASQHVPNTPSNQIYIATSSIDGHVCISSLIDPKDVQLRNFARPVQAVALSPDYKNDRTYLSGGLAGQLILTIGGKAGVSTDANTNSTAAAASGWLGSIGLGSGGGGGKDTALHSGEGSISTIKWSPSGKWVVWVNEEGIKIMRSHLKLGSEEQDDAWRRIAHAPKPNLKAWRDMASVWKARAEWVEDKNLESDDLAGRGSESVTNGLSNGNGTADTPKRKKKIEKLVVGWGDFAWILHVSAGAGYTAHSGQKQVGTADIMHKLQFRDCVVSGISLFTPSLVAILAYRTRDDDDKPIASNETFSKGRLRHRRTGLRPQLRLVNASDGTEEDVDELPISKFETLSAQDYHLGTIFMPTPLPEKATAQQKGALEAAWEAAGGGYAARLFNSSASMVSGGSGDRNEKASSKAGSISSPSPSISGVSRVNSAPTRSATEAHPFMLEPGLKLFIQSPYDCVLAIKRDLNDHLKWLLDHEKFAEAWTLLEDHPEIVEVYGQDKSQHGSQPPTPSRGDRSLADFFADSDSQTTVSVTQSREAQQASASAKEKRRIGDLWLQQLVADEDWPEAGRVAGKVLGTSSRWEHWVWTFAQANKFDEITPFIPPARAEEGGKVLPSMVYEVVLGHYIVANPQKVGELLDIWDPEMFDAGSVITAIEARLDSGEVSQAADGEDWKVLMESLAKLYVVHGRGREALRCWIRCQNADKAFEMIKSEKLVDAIADDVPGLLMLRVSKEQMRSADLSELEEASSEALQLLVEEARRGTVPTEAVIHQLERKDGIFKPFLFFYFRALWRGPPNQDTSLPRRKFDRNLEEGRALVEDHADLAVSLFVEYDREILMVFLRASNLYNYDRAATLCEQRHYIPELVYILSKTGQTKRALFLIIGELGDVRQAISFAKENGELWDDLLDYSMDKPHFIKGLLEEVGTTIDPIKMVRRIPEGLEIEGLKHAIQTLVREFEIQYSISEGVAKVLRGEVAMGMDTLRAGRKKAVRFDVAHEGSEEVDISTRDVPTALPDGQEALPVNKRNIESKAVKPGHCVGCGDPFSEEEREPLIGFACGHVYHLTCILRANPDTDDEDKIDRLLDQLGRGDSDGENYSGRSVGAKVAHAHIIKNVVQGGCRHCFVPEGA